MRITLATTPNDEPVVSSSNLNGPCTAVRRATKNETQVDLTAEIPEAPAKQLAEQSESKRFAMLQHVTLTKPCPTPAVSGPSNDAVFEKLDDELGHLRRVAE
jgi:hypothetical protein